MRFKSSFWRPLSRFFYGGGVILLVFGLFFSVSGGQVNAAGVTVSPQRGLLPNIPLLAPVLQEPDLPFVRFDTPDYPICQFDPVPVTATGTYHLPPGQSARLVLYYFIVHPTPTRPEYVDVGIVSGDGTFSITRDWPGVPMPYTSDTVVEIHFGVNLFDPTTGVPLLPNAAGLDIYWYPWYCTPTPQANTPTRTATLPNTATFTPTFTASNTPVLTSTSTIPPSATPSITPSSTPALPTPTFTPTSTTGIASLTPTTGIASLTPTTTFTFSPTAPTAASSFTPSATLPTSTTTFTPTIGIATESITPTPSFTPSLAFTQTPSFTPGPSNTPNATLTASISPPPGVEPSSTFTPTNTVAPSFTPSQTASSLPTLTFTSSPTVTPSYTPSFTPSLTLTTSATPLPILSVESVCGYTVENQQTWRITNSSSYAVDLLWQATATGATGNVTAPANSIVYLTTTGPAQNLRIYVNGRLVDEAASVTGCLVFLELTTTCTENNQLAWMAFNNNPYPVNLTWTLDGARTGAGSLEANSAALLVTTEAGVHQVKLVWTYAPLGERSVALNSSAAACLETATAVPTTSSATGAPTVPSQPGAQGTPSFTPSVTSTGTPIPTLGPPVITSTPILIPITGADLSPMGDLALLGRFMTNLGLLFLGLALLISGVLLRFKNG